MKKTVQKLNLKRIKKNRLKVRPMALWKDSSSDSHFKERDSIDQTTEFLDNCITKEDIKCGVNIDSCDKYNLTAFHQTSSPLKLQRPPSIFSILTTSHQAVVSNSQEIYELSQNLQMHLSTKKESNNVDKISHGGSNLSRPVVSNNQGISVPRQNVQMHLATNTPSNNVDESSDDRTNVSHPVAGTGSLVGNIQENQTMVSFEFQNFTIGLHSLCHSTSALVQEYKLQIYIIIRNGDTLLHEMLPITLVETVEMPEDTFDVEPLSNLLILKSAKVNIPTNTFITIEILGRIVKRGCKNPFESFGFKKLHTSLIKHETFYYINTKNRRPFFDKLVFYVV